MQQRFVNAGTEFARGYVATGGAHCVFHLVDRICGASWHRSEPAVEH
jgi:hypothetical protein